MSLRDMTRAMLLVMSCGFGGSHTQSLVRKLARSASAKGKVAVSGCAERSPAPLRNGVATSGVRYKCLTLATSGELKDPLSGQMRKMAAVSQQEAAPLNISPCGHAVPEETALATTPAPRATPARCARRWRVVVGKSLAKGKRMGRMGSGMSARMSPGTGTKSALRNPPDEATSGLHPRILFVPPRLPPPIRVLAVPGPAMG